MRSTIPGGGAGGGIRLPALAEFGKEMASYTQHPVEINSGRLEKERPQSQQRHAGRSFAEHAD
jgi:hypothetical protein